MSLCLAAGEHLLVAGPSGAGKTLLLRALALLDPLDRGRVLWRGRPLERDAVPAFRGRVIYLHQTPALLSATVEAALRQPLALLLHRRRRFERPRIVGWLKRLSRDESFLDAACEELSGGERQIVALLRALQLDPAVLLLDEATAALDRSAAAAATELLGQWLAESPQERSLVWVTHHDLPARHIAGRTVHMKQGRLHHG